MAKKYDLSESGPYATSEDRERAKELGISVAKLRQHRAEDDSRAVFIEVDTRKLYKLLYQWHYDSDDFGGDEKEARKAAKDYAKRLVERIKEEAT